MYPTGSASWGELFRRDGEFRADGRVGEGCVTTTWLQMNLKLLEMTGEARYADELERTIYNALTVEVNTTGVDSDTATDLLAGGTVGKAAPVWRVELPAFGYRFFGLSERKA